MFDTLKNAWKIAELRKKILYTLMIIILFRAGSAVPIPFLDPTALQNMVSTSGNLLGYLDVLSGGAFANATVFALSISPYITASIVVQLLAVAIPALEKLSKEGADGRKKLNKVTRYVTLGLALMQGTAYLVMLKNLGALSYPTGLSFWFTAVIIVLSFTAGSAIIVWMGDMVAEKGIGNGISILLFAGIVSRGPQAVGQLWNYLQLGMEGESQYFFFVPAIVVLFIAVIAMIVVMTNAERRIPVQYAKRVVGRKTYGGQSTHIPIKVNMTGVMPIIFASSLLAIPGTIKAFADPDASSMLGKILGVFDYNTWFYAVLYALLIVAFNYFYVAIQYNPTEMANNLRKNNGAIPGIRPGRPTVEFISKVISKITLVGAFFLAFVAILPIGLGALTKMNIALGGTTILIVVGVALDTVRQLESQMMMRHYKGFLQ